MATQRRSGGWAAILYYSGELARIKAGGEKRSHSPTEKIGRGSRTNRRDSGQAQGRTLQPLCGAGGFPERRPADSGAVVRQNDIPVCCQGHGVCRYRGGPARQGERRKKGGKPPAHSRIGATERSIDRRGEAANNCGAAGRWEMDTVKGPRNGRIENRDTRSVFNIVPENLLVGWPVLRIAPAF